MQSAELPERGVRLVDRTLAVHGLLALVAAGLALWAWRAPESSADEGLVLFEARPDEVTAVRFSDGSYDVALERRGQGFSVRVVDTKSKGPGEPLPPAKVYPATPKASDLLSRVAPLHAVRGLDPVGPEQLKAFGLDAPPMRLVVERGERKQELELGNATYGGGTHYARAGGQLYLVKAALFADLKAGANALTDRTAMGVPKEKAVRVIVQTAQGKKRELLQRHADDKARAFFADPAEPDTKLEQATTWVDRVLRTRLSDFATETPGGAPALSVEVLGEDGPLGMLELWAPDGDVALVRSKAFETPLTVSKSAATAILEDLEEVLAERP